MIGQLGEGSWLFFTHCVFVCFLIIINLGLKILDNCIHISWGACHFDILFFIGFTLIVSPPPRLRIHNLGEIFLNPRRLQLFPSSSRRENRLVSPLFDVQEAQECIALSAIVGDNWGQDSEK